MKKNIKISTSIIFLLTFLCLSIINVYAQGSAESAGKNVRTTIQNFGSIIFGNLDISNPTTLITYFFLGFILSIFIYSILDKTPLFSQKNKFLNIVLSIAIVILILSNLPKDLFSVILIPYQVLGIVLLLLLPPLVLLFFSIKTKSLAISRILWVFFSVYYLLIFISNYPSENGINLLYLAEGIIGIFMIFFVGYIREQFSNDKIEDLIEKIHLHSAMKAAEV